MTDLEIEMQTRCVHCGAEQYAPAVLDISHGKYPCVWCGKVSKPMTTKEFQEAIKLLHAKKGEKE